jgi:nucleoside phosphorylase
MTICQWLSQPIGIHAPLRATRPGRSPDLIATRPIASADRGPAADIAILTVLDEEYRQVLRHLQAPRRIAGTCGVANQYGWVTGTITSDQGIYRVVLALGRTGNAPALLAARNTIEAFRPDTLMLVGVAGALDQRLRCGDVVVSDRICGYEYGKIENGFRSRPDWSFPADQSIASAARTIQMLQPNWSEAIGTPTPNRIQRRPRSLVGQVASGNKVVDDVTEGTFVSVLRLWPNLLAVEMEALGGILAVEDARERGHLTQFSMIRGISDEPLHALQRHHSSRGNNHRQSRQRDIWKRRAAAAAATFTATLIETAWPRPPRAHRSRRNAP